MPIYEFYSPDTNRIYSFYARRLMPEAVPLCPEGAQHRMEKMISRFSFTGRAKEPQAGGEGGLDDLDPRQEAAMMELAREMEGLGDGEPDPRALGKMMRRMMDITGQKAPGEMEEMLRRLEGGEDPEKLEEEYGDLMEDFDPMGGEDGGQETGSKAGRLRRWWKKAPSRDPQLYEMSDYLNKN